MSAVFFASRLGCAVAMPDISRLSTSEIRIILSFQSRSQVYTYVRNWLRELSCRIRCPTLHGNECRRQRTEGGDQHDSDDRRAAGVDHYFYGDHSDGV